MCIYLELASPSHISKEAAMITKMLSNLFTPISYFDAVRHPSTTAG